jgi:transcriptional regulator with XRE-family HTH domain
MNKNNQDFTSSNKDYPEINKIRMLREGIGFSQDYVAKKLNITQQAYSKLEKNPDNVILKRLRELSDVLGVSLDSIVGEDETYIQQNFNQRVGNAATITHVTGLADRERALLMQQIENLQKQIEALTKIIEQKL